MLVIFQYILNCAYYWCIRIYPSHWLVWVVVSCLLMLTRVTYSEPCPMQQLIIICICTGVIGTSIWCRYGLFFLSVQCSLGHQQLLFGMSLPVLVSSSLTTERSHGQSCRDHAQRNRNENKTGLVRGLRLLRQMLVGFICVACLGVIMLILGSVFIGNAIRGNTSITVMLCVLGMGMIYITFFSWCQY